MPGPNNKYFYILSRISSCEITAAVSRALNDSRAALSRAENDEVKN